MEHYFLTDGVPDPNKTPEILELQGYKKRSKLHEAAKRAPGLEIVSHADTDLEIIYMGWDRLAVWRHTRDCSREYRRQEARSSLPQWLRYMKTHEKLVDQMESKGPYVPPKSGREPRAFKQGRGSYAVRCKEISIQWPPFSPLTLEITRGPSTFIAAGQAQFGYFSGTMLFAVDDAILAKHLDEDIEDVAAGAEEAEANPDEGSGHKRKHAPSEGDSVQSEKPKAPAHRVFFRMRTSKTGAESSKGYLDFSGEHLTTFTGEMEVPYVNGRVKLEGFKYTNSSRRYIDSWGFPEEDAQLRQNLAFAESLDSLDGY